MKLLTVILIASLCVNCVEQPLENEGDGFELSNEYELMHSIGLTLDEAAIYTPEMSYVDSVYMWVDSAESTHNGLPFGSVIGAETWTYNRINDQLEIVYIRYEKDGFSYTEEFVLLDFKLIYAIEWEEWIEGEDRTVWNCHYIIKEDTVVEYSSLGHGETETDEWEPTSIFTQWEAHNAGYVKMSAMR